MIGRLIWVVAIIAIAAVTSYAQLDRQARLWPELASGVPAPFRAFAQAHVTAEAIQQGDAESGLAEARRLIARRPIPAEHLRMLAAAQLKAGAAEQSIVSVQLAARRGWRDLRAQEAMLRLALAAGDKAEASRRYAALLHNPRSDNALLIKLGPAVFGEAGSAGRQTFADIVSTGGRWRGILRVRGAKVIPGDAYAEIMRETAAGETLHSSGQF